MDERASSDELTDLKERVERLEREVASLRGAGAAATPPVSPTQMPPAAQPASAARPTASAPPQPVRSAAPPPLVPALPLPPSQPVGQVARTTERNPVILVAVAGAAIFLLGSIFLLRVAIQQGWIGPELRLLFGLAVGVALSVVATRQLLSGSTRLGTAFLAAGLGTLEFSFYVGAFSYAFYSAATGFALVSLACIAAGALATRSRTPGAFLVAYLAAFAAPFVFSTGRGDLFLLSLFELCLFAAALLVAHLAPEARGWGFTRWAVSGSQWLVQVGVAAAARRADEPRLFALLAVAMVLAAVWIWRPVGRDAPATTPTLLWISVTLGSFLAAWLHWDHLGWPQEYFAVVALLFAGVQLALVRPARQGWAQPGGDLGLLLLAGAMLTVAVPIALEWRWVGPLWGILALGARLVAWRLGERGASTRTEATALEWVGFALAISTTVRWLVILASERLATRALVTPVFNEGFVTATLVAGAWFLVLRSRGSDRIFGYLGLEGVANLAVGFEVARVLARMGAAERTQMVSLTIVWALSGAVQWLAGLGREASELRHGLVTAGYIGLAVAAVKLIVFDLDGSPMALRAVVFLAAGGIFLGAAFAAHRFESRRRPS